ncbi:hypothetical protein D1970_17130 [Mesobacillus zeae]|uniref:Uncharacterized protein n=1 Tax=Mesobacillus zeae TaxID=1917180 RepID=A0A398B098_9BACI|nr:hypothetical protein D1970_17130 [Mesobacillus zeae]
MVGIFGLIFSWGIPALLLWSVILSIRHMAKEPLSGGFIGRTITFFVSIYSYTLSSLASWLGLITILMGFAGFTEGAFFFSILFILFGGFLVYNYFPRFNMPD